MDELLGFLVVVAIAAIVGFSVGASKTFDRCLETNKHLAYVEARQVCGEEQK